jgi:Flp pilus assembly protein TadD
MPIPSTTPTPTTSALARPRLLLLAGALVMVAATWIAYLPALRAGYVWDDDTFLYANPHITALSSPAHFWKLWGPDRPPDYFPLTSTMLWVEWHWLWGEAPAGYHAVNVALHTLSAMLLWAVLRRLGMAVGWAWVAAMLFALHPVNVESVAWITERKNTLPLPLLLASLGCWLFSEKNFPPPGDPVREPRGRYGAWEWYAAALILFALSLLAKTAGVLLPAVMMVIIWWRSGDGAGRVNWRAVARTTPFFIIAATLGAITVWYQRVYAIGSEVVRDDSLSSRVALAGRAVWFYLWKAVWPVDLSFVYPRWPAVETERLVTWIPLAVLAAVAVALWWMRRRSWCRTCVLAAAAYLAMLLPVLGLVDIYFMRYSLVADHWQYFALVAPVALLAAGAAYAAKRAAVARRAIGLTIAMILPLLGALTRQEAAKYHDIETLWHATIAANPDAWLPYNNLGSVLLLRDQARESIPYFEKAVAIDPRQTESLNNLGSAYHAIGDNERAVRQYLAALELAPNNIKVLSNLGSSYIEAGRYEEAMPFMLMAAELAPGSSRVHYNLGVALLGLGRWGEAEARFRRTIAMEPDNGMAHNNRGAALVRLGKLDEALAEFKEAVRLDSSNAQARGNVTAVENALKPRR